MTRSNPFLAGVALALGAMSPLAQPQAPPPAAATAAPATAVAPATADAPPAPAATAATATPAVPTATAAPVPRKDPPGWRLAAGRDTDDPTYCRKETVPNSRFQKERCLKLSQLQQQQVLDHRNKEVGVLSGRQCGTGSSWCESH